MHSRVTVTLMLSTSPPCKRSQILAIYNNIHQARIQDFLKGGGGVKARGTAKGGGGGGDSPCRRKITI